MTDLAAGVALCVAGFFFGLRVIFLNPEAEGWPPAPTLVRVTMFAPMAFMMMAGVEIIGEALKTGRSWVPLTLVLVFWSLAAYASVMWFNILRQRYPAIVWNRVERIMTLAHCRNGRTLIELARAGFYVFIPGRPKDVEPIGPADFADPPGLPPTAGR